MFQQTLRSRVHSEAVERLLGSFAPLVEADLCFLQDHLVDVRVFAAGDEVSEDLDTIGGARMVLAGWVGWTHDHRDGRRQIVSLALPGDRLKPAAMGPLNMWNMALTAVRTIDAGPLLAAIVQREPGARNLGRAWAAMELATEAQGLAHVLRLGGMSAYGRMANLLVELKARQAAAGVLPPRGISLPMTQEALGGLLGISTVHVNRTLQLMRREGLLEGRGGAIILSDEVGLARVAGVA